MIENSENKQITIYTIGFTKKTAEEFFNILKRNKVTKVIDTRLNNENQLAGFSKKEDLKYFLKAILDVEYEHIPTFAPTEEILTSYKKKLITWSQYENKYLELIKNRQVDTRYKREGFDYCCLLCSEAEPSFCHRRLLAEYMKQIWKEIIIKHL